MSQAKPCGSCDAPVLWATIRRRDGGASRMPLNLKPDMAGNIAAKKDVHGQLYGRVLVGDEVCEIGETRYQTHFATCVNADQHRRRDQPPDPAQQLKHAHRDHAIAERELKTHVTTCPRRGCTQCRRLAARLQRTTQHLSQLTAPPQPALFET